MKVTILGNGGFYNEGLSYNAMTIDDHVLVETPPDILQSLFRQGKRPAQIDTVFVSHVHGDHCFGFPFFFFNWLYSGGAESHLAKNTRLELIGPAGLNGQLRELMRLAIPPEHPYLYEFDKRVSVTEIDEDDIVEVRGGLWFGFRRTAHSLPTFSLVAGEIAQGDRAPTRAEYLDKALFVYSSDTSAFDGIETLLNSSAKLILCDTNGEEDKGVHMSPKELFGVARRGGHGDDFESGRIRGIHMSRLRRKEGALRFVQAGETFTLTRE